MLTSGYGYITDLVIEILLVAISSVRGVAIVAELT